MTGGSSLSATVVLVCIGVGCTGCVGAKPIRADGAGSPATTEPASDGGCGAPIAAASVFPLVAVMIALATAEMKPCRGALADVSVGVGDGLGHGVGRCSPLLPSRAITRLLLDGLRFCSGDAPLFLGSAG